MICKRTTSYLENCSRSYRYNKGTFLTATRPSAIFTISIIGNPVKNSLSKFLEFRSNGVTWDLTAVFEPHAAQNIFTPLGNFLIRLISRKEYAFTYIPV